MERQEELNELLERAERIKKDHKLDLSSDEDLSIAIMNLVSLEEHFFFTGSKTGKENYYDLLSKTREMRKELLGKIVKNPEGEIWCISKHLLAASMRLLEVGSKYYASERKEEGEEMFKKAYELYSLFWGINLKLIDLGEVKKIDDDKLNIKDTEKKSLFAKLGDLVKKLVDCCKE